MEKIDIIESAAILVPVDNIDTDQIIPARFLKTTVREGFGEKEPVNRAADKSGSCGCYYDDSMLLILQSLIPCGSDFLFRRDGNAIHSHQREAKHRIGITDNKILHISCVAENHQGCNESENDKTFSKSYEDKRVCSDLRLL